MMAPRTLFGRTALVIALDLSSATLARDLPRYGWRATMAAAWAGR